MQAWRQGWARDWAGLASACCSHVLPPLWARLCLPSGTPALASGSFTTVPLCSCPAQASPLAEPWREGAPELPEAARAAQEALWPMLRLNVPSDIFLSLLLLSCVVPVGRKGAQPGRSAESHLKHELPLKHPSSAAAEERQRQAGGERLPLALLVPCQGPGPRPSSA